MRSLISQLGAYKLSSTSPEAETRRLTATSVTLPSKESWYNRIYIPWLFAHRHSPHSNAVQTTKYTLLNFIPKNLWEQFHRLANIYFFFVAIINFIPAVEALDKEVAFLPLLFVLIVPGIKDAYEDYRRYKCDRQVNKKLVKVFDWQSKQYMKKQWSQVCVGDFVMLLSNEEIPADILLLYSSEPNQVCFIETANLDGETNLKQREVVETGTSNRESHEDFYNPENFTGELFYEPPKSKIYEFGGYIQNPDGSKIGVSRSNLLLRGCVVRNTRVVAGVVVYAGHETKSLLNNSGPRAKRSKLERDINSDIIFQVFILLVVCLTGAIGNGIWTALNLDTNASFFPFSSDTIHPALEGFTRFWSFLIIHQVIIPISLYVSMEVVKVALVYFINSDVDMYHAPTDTPFNCRALNICENLGQIQHVFSDKTGTLTENHLVFRCCTVGGVNYPHSLKEQCDGFRGSELSLPTLSDTTADKEERIEVDQSLLEAATNPELQELYIRDAFITMAICNTVLVSKNCRCKKTTESKETGSLVPGIFRRVLSRQGSFIPKLQFFDSSNGDGGSVSVEECDAREGCDDIRYEAESPDDLALVEAAKAYGYTLLSRTPSHVTITTPSDGNLTFEIIDLLEFDSERKCMSIVTRLQGSDKVTLYLKGADSMVYCNLSNKEDSQNGLEDGNRGIGMQRSTDAHLNHYAKMGLRTLCLAKREFAEGELERWWDERQLAKQSIEDREQLLHHSALTAETNLTLLGGTGVEDRLQEGVPEAIESLREAGIKLWVLTGDKQETAVNIGYSSRLVQPGMEIIQLNAHSMEHCRAELEHCLNSVLSSDHLQETSDSFLDSVPLMRTVTRRRTNFRALDVQDKALLTDGETLRLLLDPSLQKMFLAVALQCKSVLCCRVAPLQKAMVVEAVKSNLRQITLAVGDGANDASMIQKADVGVGIVGKEGRQAVMASDFAMARFKFLIKLLLVHGHWCYSRLAKMMLYFFYKNVMFALLLFWFQFFNGFSSSVPINSLSLSVFNLVYTSIPILVVSVADQDVFANRLMEDKSLYAQGRESKVYTKKSFLCAITNAVYQSLVVFFVSYGTYHGSDVGLVELGFVQTIAIVVTVTLHLALEIQHWTVFHHLGIWGSLLATFIFNYVYCSMSALQGLVDVYWAMQVTSRKPTFWLVLVLTPVIALLPKVIMKTLEQEVCPSPVLRARAEEKQEIRTKLKKFQKVHHTLGESQSSL